MGYHAPEVLPFVNSLAATFPVCDRYFCSVGAQTYPNRRFLMAGTSLGLLDDTFPAEAPPNGTVFQALSAHGISWKNYYASLPSALIWSYQASLPGFSSHLTKIDQFYADAAAGHAAVGQHGRPRLRQAVPGGPPGRPVRGPVPRQGGRRRDGVAPVAPHPAASGATTSRAATTTTSSRPRRRCPTRCRRRSFPVTPRVVRPLRVPGARRGGLALRPEGLRLPRRPRPHLDPEAGRDQVEPARPHPPGRGRRRPPRQRGPARPAGVPHTRRSWPPAPTRRCWPDACRPVRGPSRRPGTSRRRSPKVRGSLPGRRAPSGQFRASPAASRPGRECRPSW